MNDITDLTVCDLMTKNVVTIESSARIPEAIKLLEQERIGALPVVDDQNSVVGILSMTDLIGMIVELQSDLSALHSADTRTRDFLIELITGYGENTTVQAVMTSPVETVPAETNLMIAAQILDSKNYHHLPVVDESKRPIGMLSTTDFMRAFAQHGMLLFK